MAISEPREPEALPPVWRRMSGLEIIRLIVLLLIIGVVFMLWHFVAIIISNQNDIRDGQFKGKAIVCDQSAAQHLPLNPACSDPNVLRYRVIRK